jgi:hypothetical protein
VLDAGALIALDRENRDAWALLTEGHRAGQRPVIPAPVIAQAWPSGEGQARLARVLSGADLIPADGMLSRRAGELLGQAHTTDVLDALVAPTRLYHERWQVESAYFEVKKTILGGRVLRAQSSAGIAQELYGPLALYQSVRIAITDATDAVPGADPDRASFSVAVETAREQLVQAADVIDDEVIDLVGTIGRHVLDNLMPARRCRLSPRAVKRPVAVCLSVPERGPPQLPGHDQHRRPCPTRSGADRPGAVQRVGVR